ncbi:MAG: hypothetical protein K5669_00230 [Lachnospiraceae bacterium]|nr:hypothetical protein [Lachnospiraceae bacterium]
MTPLEIALLIGGLLIFVLSFVIPVKKKESSEEVKEMIEDEVKLKVKGEIEELRSHIDNVIDESIEYAQEKTERSLERISNEKIMAVNEYSDTVLDEINKNHNEVMFLYDMLNNKHEDLKSTVSEASIVAKEVKENAMEAASAAEAAHESKIEAEAAITGFKSLSSDTFPAVDPSANVISNYEGLNDGSSAAEKTSSEASREPKIRTLKWAEFALEQADEAYEKESHLGNVGTPISSSGGDALNTAAVGGDNIPLVKDTPQAQLHDQVIALHKLGKSDVEIARALDMGVGEVSLIIGLHAK